MGAGAGGVVGIPTDGAASVVGGVVGTVVGAACGVVADEPVLETRVWWRASVGAAVRCPEVRVDSGRRKTAPIAVSISPVRRWELCVIPVHGCALLLSIQTFSECWTGLLNLQARASIVWRQVPNTIGYHGTTPTQHCLSRDCVSENYNGVTSVVTFASDEFGIGSYIETGRRLRHAPTTRFGFGIDDAVLLTARVEGTEAVLADRMGPGAHRRNSFPRWRPPRPIPVSRYWGSPPAIVRVQIRRGRAAAMCHSPRHHRHPPSSRLRKCGGSSGSGKTPHERGPVPWAGPQAPPVTAPRTRTGTSWTSYVARVNGW